MRRVKRKVRRTVPWHARHHKLISHAILAIAVTVFVISLMVQMHPHITELSALVTAERLAAIGSAT